MQYAWNFTMTRKFGWKVWRPKQLNAITVGRYRCEVAAAPI